jgi:hypothetical protein
MVHNLLSIRQFTADNSCFVEFDTSGLLVKNLTIGRPSSDVIASGPFTPFGFLPPLPLLHLRPPRQLLSPQHLLPPPGTAASVIPAEMF